MMRETARNPMQLALGLPAAAVAGWANLWVDGLLVWQRLCEAQLEILSQQAAALRSRNLIARGPDWMDHYGKRARDVNVERV